MTTKTNEFKKTEIGEIPSDWDIKTFGEVASVEAGGNAPQGDNYYLNGDKPFIRVQHFDGSKKYVDKWDLINQDAINEYNLKPFPPESIVFPKSGASIHLEKRAKLPREAYVVGHLAVVNPRQDVCNSDYLYYLLKHLNLSTDSNGSTLPFLNLSFVKGKKIPVPNRLEQEKIANILSKLQRALENQERIVADLRELKAATVARLFREGLQGEPLKNTEVGEMPRSWQAAPLSTVCADTDTLNPGKDPEKIIGYVDVSSVSREECRIVSSTKYKGKDAPGRARNLVKYRDVIFATVRPTLRRVALISKDFDGQLVSTAFCVIRAIEPKAYPEYLYYVVSSPTFIAQVGRLERGANYPAVTDTNVLSQKIPLPEYDEQKEIASELMKIDKALSANTEKAKHLSDLFTVTLNQLMTGKVRIKE